MCIYLDARARLRSEVRWTRGGLEHLRAREVQRLQNNSQDAVHNLSPIDLKVLQELRPSYDRTTV